MIRNQFDKNRNPVNMAQTNFLRAVESGNIERVRDLYSTGLKNARDRHEGDTALIIAARAGHLDVLRFLIHKKAALDARNDRGSTALLEAVKTGKADCVKKLLEAGAEINVATLHGLSPLWMAAANKDAAMLKILFDHGAVASNADNPWIAASAGSEDCVGILLAQKTDLTLTTPEGNQPLHLAAASGHLNILRKLCAAGAPLEYQNKRGETPAMAALREGRREAADFLHEEYRKRGACAHAGTTKPVKVMKPFQFRKQS